MRAAIYARYSSEQQREASIADQIEICTRYARRHGWTIVATYTDSAASGASRFRPGYQRLLTDLDRGGFDAVLVEALDRFGRKLADIADLHDRCAFAGIKLHAVNVGEIGAMHIGMLGTMAQLYLSDLREKTWRGQLGRALQGKLPGGKAYAYNIVTETTGERRINDAEAAIVHRIFAEFAAGRSPRAIAKQLNAENVPGPGGRPWGDTTIRGQADRGTGILNNALYIGRLEWNRCSYVKDPRTGKRVARPNPPERWETAEIPYLRIIGEDLWNRVKARQQQIKFTIARDEDGNALNRAHRRRFLLSGLLVCGCCGGGYTIIGVDRYGCATRRSKGTCPNSLTIRRGEIEDRVFAGLREHMMAPELVGTFIEEFNAELRRLTADSAAERNSAQRMLAEADRKIASIVKAIEDGAYTPALKDRLAALERQKAEAAAKLAATKTQPVPRLHPNLSALYKAKLEQLGAALNDPGIAPEAGEVMRDLIERIVLTPIDGTLKVELYGDLARLMAFAEGTERKTNDPGPGGSGSLLSVVAGTRNCLDLLLSATLKPRPVSSFLLSHPSAS
jgi:site-specific DNA recombinase